jgi:hypothetical protein
MVSLIFVSAIFVSAIFLSAVRVEITAKLLLHFLQLDAAIGEA